MSPQPATRRALAAFTAAAALVLAGTSGAAWPVAVSGTAAARAGQLVGNAPTAAASGISIGLGWAPTPGATGYRITRAGGVGTVGGTCAGTIAATSCTDTPVLPLTTYSYTVTPVAGVWVGTASTPTVVTT